MSLTDVKVSLSDGVALTGTRWVSAVCTEKSDTIRIILRRQQSQLLLCPPPEEPQETILRYHKPHNHRTHFKTSECYDTDEEDTTEHETPIQHSNISTGYTSTSEERFISSDSEITTNGDNRDENATSSTILSNEETVKPTK